MSSTQAFDRLFDSLPVIHPIQRRIGELPKSFFPMMQWPLNRFYLGFTPQDRRREHQLQVWFQKGGMLPRAGACTICRETRNTSFHAEDYYSIWTMCAICQSCHKILHMRHRHGNAWRSLVDQYTVTGNEWFALTPLDSDADFAGYLRHRFGPRYNLLGVSVEHFPDWVKDQVPDTGMMPLDFRDPSIQRPLPPVPDPVNPGANLTPRPRQRPSMTPAQLDMFGGINQTIPGE